MLTRNKFASTTELLIATAVCGLVLAGGARGQDAPQVTQVSDPAAAPGPAPAPTGDPAVVGRVTLGHGETCDGTCDGCGPGAAHCGIWHTCLCGGPDHGYGCRFLDYHFYCMTYPVNPWYVDQRDTRVYAAAGFGAPITIPLAPTVQTQTNYSWGIPASRITPISRVAPQPGAMMGAMAPFPGVGPDGQGAPVPPVMQNPAPVR
jgi:hypothetical protein